MRVTRWQPFANPIWNTLHDLQREMNRVFDRWGQDAASAFGFGGYPAVNVWEDAENVFVEAELPGLDLHDLTIYATGGNRLTIKGERKPHSPEQAVWHRQERTFGTFERMLTLPFNVDADHVDARLENGLLLIKLPKHESAKPRKIAVKSE
jgi:HSP20 family protein